MKNIQVIDGGLNCYYPIYACTEDEFLALFPEPGQDIELIEDAISRIVDGEISHLLAPVWRREVKRSEVVGIHGTLMYEMYDRKKYFLTKRIDEVVNYR